MDEPTNDLDAETLDLLEDIVADYSGTLLLVSHDREFLDKVVTSTLVFEGQGKIGEFVGGYSDWLQQRKASAGAPRAARKAPSAAGAKPASAKPRKISYQQSRELQAMPEMIQLLEAEQARLQTAVNDPELFRRDPAEATAALDRLAILAQQLETAYSRWDALESLASG
jgi:ATP-binding cassette subfamily F protein uup